METNRTTALRDAGVVAAGLVALGHHIAEHQLPAPEAIDIDATQRTITVRPGLNWSAWLDSVCVDNERNENTLLFLQPAIRTVWTVRLPDTGTRIRLYTLRPQPVQAVGA